MIKYENLSFVERAEKLKNFYINGKYSNFIEKEQYDILKYLKIDLDTFLLELKRLKNNNDEILKDIFMFFGESKNTKAYSYLEKQISAFEKQVDRESHFNSLFTYFKEYDQEKVLAIVESLKYENVNQYELLRQFFGSSWDVIQRDKVSIFSLWTALESLEQLLILEEKNEIEIDQETRIILRRDFKKVKVIEKEEIPSPALNTLLKEELPIKEPNKEQEVLKDEQVLSSVKVEPKNNQNKTMKIENSEENRKILYEFKAIRREEYNILIKYFGKSLNEANPLSKEEEKIFYKAYQKFEQRRESLHNAYLKKLEILKKENESYYNIIIKKRGESLSEWNELETEEEVLYQEAKKKLVCVRLKGTRSIENTEETRRGLNVLKEFNSEYYQIIIKRFGESLDEKNSLIQEEHDLFTIAYKKLQKMMAINSASNTTNENKKIKDIKLYRKKLEILKQENESDYDVILKKRGESLSEWNELEAEEEVLYQEAEQRLVGFRLKKPRTIENTEENRKILKRLKEINLAYYQIIMKRFGESLDENNPLSKEEKILFTSAYTKFQTMKLNLNKIKNINLYRKKLEILKQENKSYYDIIIKKRGESLSEWNDIEEQEELLYQEAEDTISKMNLKEGRYIEDTEENRKKLAKLKEKNLEYYNIIIKRFGESLNERNPISREEHEVFAKAFHFFERIGKQVKPRKTKIKHKEAFYKKLEILKQENESYYLIILKKRGESLNDWNTLDNQEDELYLRAFQKLNEIRLINDLVLEDTKENREILNILKETNVEYYDIIMKRFGESLQERNPIPMEEKNLFYHAYRKFKKLQNIKGTHLNIDKYREKLEVLKQENESYYFAIIEKMGDSLTEWNELEAQKELLYLRAIKALKNTHVYHERIIEDTKENRRILNILKEINFNYYQILIKRFGESLQEKNPILKEENFLFSCAYRKFKELKDMKESNVDKFRKKLEKLKIKNAKYYHIIIKKRGESLTEWNELKENEESLYLEAMRTLNDMFAYHERIIEDTKENRRILNILKEMNSNYYQILIKRFGESLNEKNSISKEEHSLFNCAYRKFKELKSSQHFNKEEFIRQELKNRLKCISPIERQIIKARRSGVSSIEIAQKYQLSLEKIYQIYTDNIILLGMEMKSVIQEIALDSETNILKNQNFQIAQSFLSKKEQLKWVKEIFFSKENLIRTRKEKR